MKADKYEIKLVKEESDAEGIEAYYKIFRWLLKRYYEGCEGLAALVYLRVSTEEQAERVFNTSSEG